MTELVANAWDAGAGRVDILIPSDKNNNLVIEDDGHGMSDMQFKARWMKLGYDREKHQGTTVEFPPDKENLYRRPYGRNGVGRHGLLCFADEYTVETWRENKGYRFQIGTQSQTTPFEIKNQEQITRTKQGTKLFVVVNRHLPDPDEIRKVLAARFIHDPQFVVSVNGISVPLADQIASIDPTKLKILGCPPAEAYVIDSTKGAKRTIYQGVAFWVNGRLVGIPSWVIGFEAVLDGRARFAKRYSIVIKTDDAWMSEVERDWTRFKNNHKTQALFETVRNYVKKIFADLSETLVEESSEEALIRNRDDFKGLSFLERAEVATFARDFVKSTPTVSQEVVTAAVQALINLEKARGGAALLEKLTKLDESDIAGLDKLLSQWTVRDALSVLDEIDHRMAVIVAIEKLSGDESADELHTLHPLVTQARWLFGPEFDSSEYASNISLRTATEKIFHKRLPTEAFVNHKQRPDILVLEDATFSVVGTEAFDSDEPALTKIQNVLLIELKKGKHPIGRDEMNQADGYVQDFLNSGALDGTPFFRAFVVGHAIAPKTSREKDLKEDNVLRAKVQAVTYGQLTRSAHQRLFKLKERIPARYEDVSGSDLSAKIMNTPSQSDIFM